MRKGQKHEFLVPIQETLADSWDKDRLPASTLKTAFVVDAMAFVQRHNTLGATKFANLQQRYVDKVLRDKQANCNCVHFVGDRYDFSPTESLKAEERDKRQSSSKEPACREYVPSDTLDIPEWKGFCSNPNNKANYCITLIMHGRNVTGNCQLIYSSYSVA